MVRTTRPTMCGEMEPTVVDDPMAVAGPLVRRAPAATVRITWVLVVLAVATSLIGIWHGGDGYYAPYPVPLAGLVGQDIATLVVGVPVLALSAVLAGRGSVRGLLVWAAALFYFAYAYAFFVIGAVNPGFPAYMAIVALALYGLLSLLIDIDPDGVRGRFGPATPVRPVAGYLLVVGGFFAVMWGGMSVSAALSGGTLDPVVHGVVVADCCVLLPALLAGGWKLWFRVPWGYALGGILLAKVLLTSATVAFTTLLNVAWTGAVSGFDAFLLGLFAFMAIVAAVLLVAFLRGAAPGPGTRVTAV
jgi:hypothetical protein